MRKFRMRRPSGALVVAFVALVAALSGTSVALPGKNNVDSGDIQNGQVRSSDIRNNGVRGRDIARNTVTGADVSERSLGTVPSAATAATAGSAASARTAGSANFAATAGTAGPYAYARVAGNGDVDPAFSKNVGPGDVTSPTLGVYCFELSFNPKSTLATLEIQGQGDEILSALDEDSPNAVGGLPNCPAGTDVEVNAFDISANALDDDPFYIQFNL